ncbi:hypothetical protein A2227_06940 [Candidatus Falkowbacteria bacterium RIFOXYA2_FULL_47_19]|uniref:Uncharacterized protein n=1 Tax=Candidatus Falkowbacteria bacterium RIFOXYA2_FULL_47_19 TaxID=1797994 RepID=A0A1F5SEM9_9BACT|nr:MAG: hypothetical protein A2227_06940 [Candidatus Falkowbacteria bacterium RIFOXYA2_FULL_47_19]
MKKTYLTLLMLVALVFFSGCALSFQPDGPDSGEEIDVNEGPDSGEEIDVDESPDGPDSGEEIDFDKEPDGPDSGEEIDVNEGPDSGEEIDVNEGPDSGEEIDVDESPDGPDSGEEIDPDEPTSPDSGEEITLSEDLKNKARGSCDRIGDGSTCVEYIGANWSGNRAALNCGGAFKISPCPRPTIGGCRIGAETADEIVTWHYDYGGDPYTAEVQPYAAAACNALPAGHWIN